MRGCVSRRGAHSEIVLGVLIEILGCDRVTADPSFPSEGYVALEKLLRTAADFDARAIAVKRLTALLWLKAAVSVGSPPKSLI